MSHDSGGNDELEAVIDKFFRNLFPLAYHHAVHSQNVVPSIGSGGEEEAAISSTATSVDMASRDFHIDYKNCLTSSYEILQPFGDIPYSISRSLVQSVSSASVLLRALQRGTEVLSEIENLPIESSLSMKCQHALLKMDYCSACKGHNYHHLKPCYGYCSNVMRYVCVYNSMTLMVINCKCLQYTILPFMHVNLYSYLSLHRLQRLPNTAHGWHRY